MNMFLAPGILVMRLLTNKGKMPLASILFLIPLGLLYFETAAHASIAIKIAVGILTFVAVYAMASWYAQSREGFTSLAKVIGRLAEGDLTSGHGDDLGGHFTGLFAALRKVNSSLGGIVAHVRTSANALAHSANEIADSNSDLSRRTEQQASTLEETASGMEELSRTVRQNADNCKSASNLAKGAETVARQGAGAVHDVVTGMENIHQSSARMADIVGVIEGIAFQTNILALNAAVEAARAGEQGRGFAVVASEVRSLAQRSAEAAKEIRSLIATSVGEVAEGSRKAERAGTVIDEIVKSVHEVSELIGQIAVSSTQQSAGLHEINKAIMQLESVTQQNAALVQEGAASTQTLSERADAMRTLVARFKIAEETPGPSANRFVAVRG